MHEVPSQPRHLSRRSNEVVLGDTPSVSPITVFATEVFLGDPRRFADAKAAASCVGQGVRRITGGLLYALVKRARWIPFHS